MFKEQSPVEYYAEDLQMEITILTVEFREIPFRDDLCDNCRINQSRSFSPAHSWETHAGTAFERVQATLVIQNFDEVSQSDMRTQPIQLT